MNMFLISSSFFPQGLPWFFSPSSPYSLVPRGQLAPAPRALRSLKLVSGWPCCSGPFLGLSDSLEKEMATTPVFLLGEIPWTEKPGGLQSMEVTKESDMT